MIVTFTYNRLAMLIEQANELSKIDQSKLIIDDESDYPFSNLSKLAKKDPKLTTVRMHHCGKKGFYKLWDFALDQCEKSNDDFFLFLPDDYTEIDFERIMETHNRLNDRAYVCNVVNDGRPQQWTTAKEQPFDLELTRVDWTDCGFFCNRLAFDWIGFEVHPVPPIRFTQKGISSGVGEQLTKRWNHAGVPIYRPIKSFAYHGDHVSVMHPETRVKQPLIAK
tara:strand:- start:16456 stop:17121 length:666 start_codon:yes stop_codon:yes gene_type:complete